MHRVRSQKITINYYYQKTRKVFKSKKESTSKNFIFSVTLTVEEKEERDLTMPKKNHLAASLYHTETVFVRTYFRR